MFSGHYVTRGSSIFGCWFLTVLCLHRPPLALKLGRYLEYRFYFKYVSTFCIVCVSCGVILWPDIYR